MARSLSVNVVMQFASSIFRDLIWRSQVIYVRVTLNTLSLDHDYDMEADSDTADEEGWLQTFFWF